MLILSLFSLLKTIQKAKKTDPKLTLHYMGKMFISELTEINFLIWRVTFLTVFHHWFFRNNGNIECALHLRRPVDQTNYMMAFTTSIYLSGQW